MVSWLECVNFEAMSVRPLLIPLASLACGISAAGQWQFFSSVKVLFAVIGICFLAIFVRRRGLFAACLSLSFFTAGAAAMEPFLAPRFPADAIVRCCGPQPLTIEGIVDARPDWRQKGGRIFLRITRVFQEDGGHAASGRLLLSVGDGNSRLYTGDLVRFVSRINKPRNFGVPGEFDYERFLAFRRVHATAYVQSADQVVLVRRNVAFPLRQVMDRFAADFGGRMEQLVPGPDGAVLRALILGDSGLVPRETRELFARTGASHILCISGFHVGVVALFFFTLVFSVARRSPILLMYANPRRSILLLTIPVLLFYLFLSGGAPATVRAVIMICAYIAAFFLQRETDPVHSLMLAALLILVASPPALFDISFQLSFLAIWGILVLTPLLMRPFRKVPPGPVHKLLLFLMVSVAATAATMIPAVSSFHKPTLTGLVANFLIIPLMGYGAVVLGFSSLPFMHLLPGVARELLLGAGFLVDLSVKALSCLDALPLLPVWSDGRFDLVLLVAFLAALTFFDKRLRVVCCCLVVAAFIVLRIVPSDAVEGQLRLDFFSVGQGEASLITFPDGRRMLIDGGGSYREGGFDPGERLLAPALWRRGISRLDYLVLSHPHPDHLNGLLYLARNFAIGEFWESGIHDGGEAYCSLKKVLSEQGVPTRRIDALSEPIKIGAVRVEPLGPRLPADLAESRRNGNLNETSLVFRLCLADFSILFSGDIGSETEGSLALDPSRLRCTVLKVPHHGSRYSSTEAFLDAAAPQCALIGAGYGNRFRLPSGVALERFRRRLIPVYRTDLDGTITVIHANGGWSVRTFRENRHFR